MTTETKPQTASEKAAVMLAFDRGEKVERGFSDRENHEAWLHDSNPSWNWQHFEWRVMAKPFECWMWVYLDGRRSLGSFYGSKDAAEKSYKGCAGRAVFMREVIE